MYLSIIIPTLGRSKELVDVLRSIEPELSDDVEVIIVDQNSKGFLDKIIPFDLQARITVHHTDEKGLSKAKNTGIALAKGRYINFCDDDAIVEPGLKHRIMLGFERYPQASMITFRVFDLLDDVPCMIPFPESDCQIGKSNYYSTTIEFAQVWVTKDIRELEGYDVQFGVGAPFGAEEGKDLLVRALEASHSMFYIADTGFRHPSKQEASMKRYFSYAEGTAAFACKHWRKSYVTSHVAGFLFKSVAGVMIYNVWKRHETQRYWMRLAGFFSGMKKKIKGA